MQELYQAVEFYNCPFTRVARAKYPAISLYSWINQPSPCSAINIKISKAFFTSVTLLLDNTSKYVINTAHARYELIIHSPLITVFRSLKQHRGVFKKHYWNGNTAALHTCAGDGGKQTDNLSIFDSIFIGKFIFIVRSFIYYAKIIAKISKNQNILKYNLVKNYDENPSEESAEYSLIRLLRTMPEIFRTRVSGESAHGYCFAGLEGEK